MDVLQFFTIAGFTIAAAFIGCANADGSQSSSAKTKIIDTANKAASEPIAVIELFTSQGCSSCPPADKLLSTTISRAEKSGKKIYALSFHVDYWNRLGWADPFSDKAYSQRQSAYVQALGLDGAYTPQMIVNGKTAFVGSNSAALSRALGAALDASPKATISQLSATKVGNIYTIKYNLQGDYKNAVLNIALVSAYETTAVKRGENGGRTLTNENIVKGFKTVVATESGTSILSGEVSGNASIVAYVQNKQTMEVLGASGIPLAATE